MSSGVIRFPLPSLEEQADLAEKHSLETLLFCPDPWALRHVFINQDTGEVVRARCNRWDCLYCGPRKVDQWRQLVKAAEPTLFITLTKAGTTVEEAARALTTFLQYLRRGSKGRGKEYIGAREAYPVEYFAVLERHSDFEENGFHWHLLVKGVEFIPHEVLKEAWRSARHGVAYIVDVQAIRKPHVIGYVTKYLTKSLSTGEKGIRQEEREKVVIGLDDEGNLVEERQTYTVEFVSKARRIRYSRHFFSEKVSELRVRLFAELEQESMEQAEQAPSVENTSTDETSEGDTGKPIDAKPPPVKRSSWSLVQQNEGLSAKSIALFHAVLHKAFDHAVRLGILPRNICNLVSPPRPEEHEVHPLTLEQIQQLLKSAKGHKLEAFFVLALVTGMRRGELVNDLKGGQNLT